MRRRGDRPKTGGLDQEPLLLHGVRITHPARVLFEEGQITKGDVARYYAAVAPFLLQDIRNRPISLLRCPGGMKAQCFYQRNVGSGLGEAVRPFAWNYKGRSYKYISVTSHKGIMEMVQMGVIEFHPWGATVDHVHTPDRMIFDLDPDSSLSFSEVKRAAVEIRRRLQQAGLESCLKCTGGKGLHIVVPLEPIHSWDEVKGWARQFAHNMVQAAPDTYVATITKSKRRGKILIDFFRNDYTATGIASYSLRARPGAPIALPLEWHELDSLLSADQFRMDHVLRRTARGQLPKPLAHQGLPGLKKEGTEKHGCRRARPLADGSAARRRLA
jgi:bifunctional non-homologous end joining protein LigD